MTASLRLGRIAGIPIGASWSVLVIGLLIAWSLAGTILPGQAPGFAPAAYWLAGGVGAGLFFGAELVHDRETREPAPDIAGRVINAMRDRGVLMGKTGIHGNVLKIRPPMPFSRANAELLIGTLDEVLGEVGGATA